MTAELFTKGVVHPDRSLPCYLSLRLRQSRLCDDTEGVNGVEVTGNGLLFDPQRTHTLCTKMVVGTPRTAGIQEIREFQKWEAHGSHGDPMGTDRADRYGDVLAFRFLACQTMYLGKKLEDTPTLRINTTSLRTSGEDHWIC